MSEISFHSQSGDALVVIDVQRDFLSGGDEVIGPLGRYVEWFHSRGLPVFASRDWHPPGDAS